MSEAAARSSLRLRRVRRMGPAAATAGWWALCVASAGAIVVALDGSSSGAGPRGDKVGHAARVVGERAQSAIDVLPGNLDPGMPGRPWVMVGCLALGTAAALVSTVHCAARRRWLPRLASTALVVVGVWGLVLVLPSVLADELKPIDSWIWVPFAFVGTLMTAKVAFLYRAAGGFVHAHPPAPALLGNQQRVYDALTPIPSGEAPVGPFTLKQITGGWGTGKSQLLLKMSADAHEQPRRWLALRRRSRPSTVCVCIDIWKHETDVDIHRAIVDNVYSHPACLLPWGWLRYPVAATAVSHLRSTDLSLPLLKTGGVQVAIPRLSWQRPLERAVARCVARGSRVVIVLDEIDRASNVVAQAALTMVHRSLDLPGVTVVLVHVPDVLDLKAFSPLTTTLPDLRSNASAQVLLELDRRDGPPGDDEEWKAFRNDLVPTPPAQPAPPVGAGSPSVSPASGVGVALPDLDQAAALAFGRMSRAERWRVTANLREKFLSSHELVLGPLDAGDIAQLLSWPAVEAALRRAMGLSEDQPTPQLAGNVERKVDEWAAQPVSDAITKRGVSGATMPAVRPLRDELERLLNDLAPAAGEDPLVEADVLLLVEAALETTTIRHRGGPS